MDLKNGVELMVSILTTLLVVLGSFLAFKTEIDLTHVVLLIAGMKSLTYELRPRDFFYSLVMTLVFLSMLGHVTFRMVMSITLLVLSIHIILWNVSKDINKYGLRSRVNKISRFIDTSVILAQLVHFFVVGKMDLTISMFNTLLVGVFCTSFFFTLHEDCVDKNTGVILLSMYPYASFNNLMSTMSMLIIGMSVIVYVKVTQKYKYFDLIADYTYSFFDFLFRLYAPIRGC